MALEPISQVHELAGQLTVLAATASAVRAERDEAIRAAFQTGSSSITHIALAAGITPARVSAILGHPRGRPGRPPNGTDG